MNDFVLYIATAIALIFVIEGLIYALFPDFVRKMMAMAVMLPVSRLRLFGGMMVLTGGCIIWGLYALIGE
ncbi:MAG: DUF2065 domain-containing protein [Rhodospirillales bacterium]|nr:DUF2065 domain-containing protein [Rhodospirillales bacterium]